LDIAGLVTSQQKQELQFRTGRLFNNRRISLTLRGEVLVLSICIQSGPIYISTAVGYVYNFYSSLYKLF